MRLCWGAKSFLFLLLFLLATIWAAKEKAKETKTCPHLGCQKRAKDTKHARNKVWWQLFHTQLIKSQRPEGHFYITWRQPILHTWKQPLLTLTSCLCAESSNKGMSLSKGWPFSSAWSGGYHDTTITPGTKYRRQCSRGNLTLAVISRCLAKWGWGWWWGSHLILVQIGLCAVSKEMKARMSEWMLSSLNDNNITLQQGGLGDELLVHIMQHCHHQNDLFFKRKVVQSGFKRGYSCLPAQLLTTMLNKLTLFAALSTTQIHPGLVCFWSWA